MKKFLLSCMTLMALSLTANAQIEKKTKYLGGMLGVQTASVIPDNIKSTQIGVSIAPEFGYFAARNFKVGIAASYAVNRTSNDTPPVHLLLATPNMNYYVRICDRLYYTPGLNFGFVYCGTNSINLVGATVGLDLGAFEVFASKRLSVAFSVLQFAYLYLHDTESEIENNTLSFGLGNASLGIRCYF